MIAWHDLSHWHQLPLFLATYGYGALFVASILEGPIVTVVAGFLASQGLLDLTMVLTVSVLGDLTGDMILYGLGASSSALRGGGSRTRSLAAALTAPNELPRVLSEAGQRARQRRRLRLRRLAMLRRRFRAHPGKTLLFGKLTHGAGFLFLLAAGAARIRPSTFLCYNFLGTVPKSAAFLVLGYLLGAAFGRIGSYLAAGSAAVFILICIAGLALARRLAVQKQTEACSRDAPPPLY